MLSGIMSLSNSLPSERHTGTEAEALCEDNLCVLPVEVSATLRNCRAVSDQYLGFSR